MVQQFKEFRLKVHWTKNIHTLKVSFFWDPSLDMSSRGFPPNNQKDQPIRGLFLFFFCGKPLKLMSWLWSQKKLTLVTTELKSESLIKRKFFFTLLLHNHLSEIKIVAKITSYQVLYFQFQYSPHFTEFVKTIGFSSWLKFFLKQQPGQCLTRCSSRMSK